MTLVLQIVEPGNSGDPTMNNTQEPPDGVMNPFGKPGPCALSQSRPVASLRTC